MSSVKKNYIYNLAYQILLIVLPLITTPFVSRVLGAEQVGVYSFTYSIVSYFILFGTLGVSLYGQREIAFNRDDPKKRTRAFWQINIVKWVAMLISLAVYGVSCITNSEFGWYYAIFVIEMIASMFDITWYFQGLERFKTITIRNAIVKIIGVASIFIFVRSEADLWIYILIFCLQNLFSYLSLWLLLPKTIVKGEFKFTGVKKHIAPILLMFLPQATMQIYTMFDRTMLGLMTNNMNEVGIYEQSQKIIKTALTIVTALGTVMCSRVANLLQKGERAKIKSEIKQSFHFVWMLATPIFLGVIGVASNLVPWFLGDGFEGAVSVMQIGALLVLAIGMSNVAGVQYLVAMGRQKEYTISIVVGAVSNFVGNLILIPLMSANGAILASVISEIIVTGTQFYFLRKDFSLKDIFVKSPRCLLAGGIMLGGLILISQMLTPSLLNTCIMAVMGALVYGVILAVLGDDMIREYLMVFRKKLLGK